MATPAHDAAAVARPDAPTHAAGLPSAPAGVDAITETDRDKEEREAPTGERTNASSAAAAHDVPPSTDEAPLPGAAAGAGRAGSAGNTTAMGGTGAKDDASASAPVRAAEDRPPR
jgi:hypothetical protein